MHVIDVARALLSRPRALRTTWPELASRLRGRRFELTSQAFRKNFDFPGHGLELAATALDRFGKGIRTAPRDALISMSSEPEKLGLAFLKDAVAECIGQDLRSLELRTQLFLAARRRKDRRQQ